MLKRCVLLLGCVLCLPHLADAANYTWTGSGYGEVWSNTSLWTTTPPTGAYPGLGDTANVSSGIVSVDTGTPYVISALNKTFYQTNANINLSGEGRIYAYNNNNYLYGIQFGTVNGANISIKQSGGYLLSYSFMAGTDLINSGASINVDYTMTQGQFQSNAAIFGQGNNVNSTFTVSGSSVYGSTNYTDIYSSSLLFGVDGGTGTFTMTGGRLLSIGSNGSGYGLHGITLGVNGGTGYMTFTGNAVSPETTMLYTVGGNNNSNPATGGTGYATHSGNASFETRRMVIGDAGATGTLNLSTGYLHAIESAVIGTGAGNATMNQTCGGLFQIGPYKMIIASVNEEGGSIGIQGYNPNSYGLFIGAELASGAQAVYNMPCGNLLSYGDVYVGYMSTPNASYNGSLAQWNISKNAVANIVFDTGGQLSGDLHIGYVTGIVNDGTPTANLTQSEININGGSLSVVGNVIGYNKNSHLNIYGSKADLNFGGLIVNNQSTKMKQLDINFLIDSYGASTINAGTVNLTGETQPLDVNIPGFISLKVDYTDLIRTSSLTKQSSAALWQDNTPFNFTENRLIDSGQTVVRLEIANNHPTWNIMGVYNIFDDANPMGKESGAVKVAGEYSYIQAIFKNLAGEVDVETGTPLYDLLMDYLNNAVVETGVHFGALTADSFLLTGPYLNDSGYAWFGWDLSEFNGKYGSNVLLYQFNSVPEPATWIMLLLGGMVVMLQRRRRK